MALSNGTMAIIPTILAKTKMFSLSNRFCEREIELVGREYRVGRYLIERLVMEFRYNLSSYNYDDFYKN